MCDDSRVRTIALMGSASGAAGIDACRMHRLEKTGRRRQFSNCYVWQSGRGSPPKVTIVRTISSKLQYHYRWGQRAHCRGTDSTEPSKFGTIRCYVLLSAQRHAFERHLARAND